MGKVIKAPQSLYSKFQVSIFRRRFGEILPFIQFFIYQPLMNTHCEPRTLFNVKR